MDDNWDVYNIPLMNEQSALGGCFHEPEAVAIVLSQTTPQDYVIHPYSSLIYNAIAYLSSKNIPITELGVAEDIIKRQKAGCNDDVVSSLSSYVYRGITGASFPENYCKKVRDQRMKAELNTLSYKINEWTNELAGEEILNRTQSEVDRINKMSSVESNTFSTQQIVENLMPTISERKNNPVLVTGITSGFSDLDNLTNGWHSPDLIILAARPSMGKTAFMLNTMQHIALNEKLPVLIYSLEMSKEQLTTRLLSAMSGVNSQNIQQGTMNEEAYNRVLQAADILHSAPIYIHDMTNLTPSACKAVAMKVAHKTNQQLGMIFIDYLQLMSGSSATAGNRVQEVSEISRSLKTMAREFSVPVMALSQLSRAVEMRDNKRPMLSDLRESGSIEQDADIVGFLYRDEYYDKNTTQPGIAELNIAKQRNGPVGGIQMYFDSHTTQFRSLPPKQQYHSNFGE